MSYLARIPMFRLLQLALIPLLLLSLLAVNSQVLNSSGQENSRYEVERHEHKIIQPFLIHTTQLKFLPNLRLNHPGIIPDFPPETSAAVLVVSLHPVIYLMMKRRRLYPLKYTSDYVSIFLPGRPDKNEIQCIHFRKLRNN
ncbi:hypothetical protein [Paenibacillus sp. S150]|uniref:hypothetical protein n=1 Tax=Paenibacillus sp. S150 TaxID=2749826 RepID=UPI001C5690CC|nr:hypothetical protein [Paenibacillus sp. S150]MBW4083990.1 hypothetical protein [Paenibacillus sp. S150]